LVQRDTCRWQAQTARGEPEVKLELDGVSAGAVMVPEGFAEAEVSCSFFSKSITIAVLPSGKLAPQMRWGEP
jgi:hypothetical protein